MAGNVIKFPNTKLTPVEALEAVLEEAKEGEIEHVLIITVSKKTEANLAMSTIPAYWAVYMAWYADKVIQQLIKGE